MAGKDSTVRRNFNFNNFIEPGRDGVKKGLIKIALMIEAQAVLLAPVATGRLRGSITYSIENQGDNVRSEASASDGVNTSNEPLVAVIGTNVEYAETQEYGSARQGYAQPYLRPAFDLITGARSKAEIMKEMQIEFQKQIAKQEEI
jgi:hypothetical protein